MEWSQFQGGTWEEVPQTVLPAVVPWKDDEVQRGEIRFYRTKVPGGWLVLAVAVEQRRWGPMLTKGLERALRVRHHLALTFLPDATHSWKW